MFESIRKALSLGIPVEETHRPASVDDVARWAAAHHAVLETDEVPGGYALSGQTGATAWRVECGIPTRSYIRDMELRGGADTTARPDAAVMVLGRALQEQLEGETFGQAQDVLQSELHAHLPEEVRWLAMYEEVAWEDLPPAFTRHFAVMSSQVETAECWIHPRLVSRLMSGLPVTSAHDEAGALPAPEPFVLMLARGQVYLRMSYAEQSLRALARGVDILTMAAQAAAKGLPGKP